MCDSAPECPFNVFWHASVERGHISPLYHRLVWSSVEQCVTVMLRYTCRQSLRHSFCPIKPPSSHSSPSPPLHLPHHCEYTVERMGWQCKVLLSFAYISLLEKLEKILVKGVKNDASARPRNLTSASCDLELWPFDPQSWLFYVLAAETTCANLHWNRLICSQNIVFASLVTDGRTDRWTDRRTSGEHYACDESSLADA